MYKRQAYVSSSEISRINQNAGLSYIQVSEETFDFLKTAKEYCKRSQGLFDITIGPLVDLWDITGENPRVPDEREIQSVLKRVNYEDLLLREEDHSVMPVSYTHLQIRYSQRDIVQNVNDRFEDSALFARFVYPKAFAQTSEVCNLFKNRHL